MSERLPSSQMRSIHRNWAMIGAIALSVLAWVAITAAAVGIYRAWP